MLRLSMVSEEEARDGWKERLCEMGVTLIAERTNAGSTVYHARRGDSTLLMEQTTGRAIATWISHPTAGQHELAKALIDSGAARLDGAPCYGPQTLRH